MKSSNPQEQAAYEAKLQAMSDEALEAECRDKIWLSAFADGKPRAPAHWQCDATYDEAKRREKPDIYSRAHSYHTSKASKQTSDDSSWSPADPERAAARLLRKKH